MGDALPHQQTEINRSRAKSRAVISFLLSKRHTRQRRPLRHTACATSPASEGEAGVGVAEFVECSLEVCIHADAHAGLCHDFTSSHQG